MFPAFETELTEQHNDHLDAITRLIKTSFDSSSRPISQVKIIGHSATWQDTSRDDYRRLAIVRAKRAKTELQLRLNAIGLGTKVSIDTDHRFNDKPLVPNFHKRTDRTARNNRKINRRVEIRLFRTNKKKKKSCKISKLIRTAPVDSIAENEAERRRLECLREQLASGLCGAKIDDRYWVFLIETFRGQKRPCNMVGLDFPQGIVKLKKPRRALKRFKEGIKSSKDRKDIAQEIKKLHDDILCQINALSFFISNSVNDIPKSTFIGIIECIDARMLMRQSVKTRPQSVYKCFTRLLKDLFSEPCSLE